MEKFSDYEDVKASGDYERLKLGGHICKILEVKIETYTKKATGEPFKQMILKIDIAEPDEQAGYYQRKFADAAKENALEAKWKGYYKLTVPTDKSEDFIKSNFKTLTTSIEKSNPGYKWNWEENTLVGKVFGGVFGLEEFENAEGKVISFSRCRFVRSTEKVLEIEPPKVKLANKTLMDYDDYVEMKREQRKQEGNKDNNNKFEEEVSSFESAEDLPF